MYYPKGGINQKTGNPRTQAEATTFNISDEEGMKNFFRAIMGHTDDPTKTGKRLPKPFETQHLTDASLNWCKCHIF